MCGTFTVQTDPSRGLLLLTLSGFFNRCETLALRDARDAALAGLGTAPNQHVTLCDVSSCKIQAQDIVEVFATMLADPASASSRLAIVTGSSLARMQVRRLTRQRSGLAFFDARRDAEAWLFEESRTIPIQ